VSCEQHWEEVQPPDAQIDVARVEFNEVPAGHEKLAHVGEQQNSEVHVL